MRNLALVALSLAAALQGGLLANGCSSSSSSSKGTASVQSSTPPETTPLKLLGWQGSRGVVGQPFSRQFPAAGGRTPYTWSLLSGDLPPGLSLSSNGQVSGTPTQAGTFSYTYQVRDQRGETAAGSLDQTIDATGTAPSFKVVIPTGIPTFSGTTFAFQPFMEGAQLPATWTYTLPANITADPVTGTLMGTLVTSGSFQAQATVSDVTGANASPITFDFGVSLGGAGVNQPPATSFDGTWDVVYVGGVRQLSSNATANLSGEQSLFTISNGIVSPSGTVSPALNTIADVVLPSSLGFQFKLGGSITSGGTASGTWAPLTGSGWEATGGNTWTATRR